MIWSKIHDSSQTIGFAIAFIAVGAFGQSIIDKSSKLPWLHQQAAVAHKLQTVDIPHIKSVAGCQTIRAQIATKEAVASEKGADVDVSKIPNCPKLPEPRK